jgi:hypothetical protein
MLASMTDSPIFALVDVHVALWVELLAAADGDEPARRLALAAWRPAVEAIEAIIPRIVRPVDGWNTEAAARGLATAIEQRRQRAGEPVAIESV